jgi:multicomponent Na+:H+ antiporter subunit G
VNPVMDTIGASFLLLGAMLCFAASVGLVRFPDVLTRMHAATKPQTLGLLFVVAGVALSLQNLHALGILLLVAVLQLLTAPVAAHMVSRTAYRTGQVRSDLLAEDDLAHDLAAAGFHLVSGDQDEREDADGESSGSGGTGGGSY